MPAGMPTSLRSTLDDLATSFTTAVLAAIRGSSIGELYAESGSPRRGRGRPTRSKTKTTAAAARASASKSTGGRLSRRSPADIEKVLARVVATVKTSKSGLRAEEIRMKLGLRSNELPRILKQGLATKRLKSKGQKRATTYFGA
jgi:hypothetical protein